MRGGQGRKEGPESRRELMVLRWRWVDVSSRGKRLPGCCEQLVGGAAICRGGEQLREAGECEGPVSHLVGDVRSLGRGGVADGDGSDQHLCLTPGTRLSFTQQSLILPQFRQSKRMGGEKCHCSRLGGEADSPTCLLSYRTSRPQTLFLVSHPWAWSSGGF